MDQTLIILIIVAVLACALYIVTNMRAKSSRNHQKPIHRPPVPPTAKQQSNTPKTPPPTSNQTPAPSSRVRPSSGTASTQPISSSARPSTPPPTLMPQPVADPIYQRLLARARGNQAQVERLIEYEARRSPHASRTEWIQDALDRWERDNR